MNKEKGPSLFETVVKKEIKERDGNFLIQTKKQTFYSPNLVEFMEIIKRHYEKNNLAKKCKNYGECLRVIKKNNKQLKGFELECKNCNLFVKKL